MGKLLQFPTKQEIQQKEDTEILNEASNRCVDSSHYLLEVLEEFINTGEISEDFMDMDFRDETKQESRDMFVVVNMLNAMFNRWYQIPHGLHQTMDNAYIKIKEMILLNEETNHELAEYKFEPSDSDLEIDFKLEDEDDTD